MIEEDLIRRFYDELAVDPESVRRVTAAVTGTPTTRGPGRSTVVAILAGVGVIAAIAALLVAVHLGRGSGDTSGTQSRSSSSRVAPPPPVAVPNELVGTVLRDGAAAPNAELTLLAWPNGAALSKLHKGDKVRTAKLGTADSDADGRLVIHIPRRYVTGTYLEGDAVNVEFDLSLPDGRIAQWNSPIQVTGPGRTAPVTITFDIGTKKVIFNGVTSTFIIDP